jgi:hypothetical protein
MKIVFYDMKIKFCTNNCPGVYLVQAMNDQYLIIEVIGKIESPFHNDLHDVAKLLLKVALNAINQTISQR